MNARQFYMTLLDEIAVPLDEIQAARTVRDALGEAGVAVLREFGLTGRGFFGAGALAMGTQIDPLHDVDLVIFSDHVLLVWKETPHSALDDLCKELDDRIEGGCETTPHAVRLALPDENYTADIVFGCTHPNGGLLIPHCPDDEPHCWIRTHPRRHAELVRERNQKVGNDFAREVRILKALNRRWALRSADGSAPVSSWHMTVLALAVLTTPFAYESATPRFLEAAADLVLRPVKDPAGVGPHLEANDPEWASSLMREAAAATREALMEGMQAEAILRDVFGEPKLAVSMASGVPLAIAGAGKIGLDPGKRAIPDSRSYGGGE